VKVLFVVTRWPWPPRRGNELRAAQWIEALAEEHEVTLVAPSAATRGGDRGRGAAGPNGATPPELANLRVVTTRREPLSALAGVVAAALTGTPLQHGLYRSRSLRHAVRREAPRHDLNVLQLARLEPLAAELTAAPLWVDLVDSLSLNFARRAEFESAWRAPIFAAEARRLFGSERRLIERATLTTVVCERDRSDLARRLDTRASERLEVLPVAIDLAERPHGAAAERRRALVLSGNLGYFPTCEGARWFLRSVWPELRRRQPQVELWFAGARPPKDLVREALAAGVRVVDAPDDLRRWVGEAAISLAPARAGSGVSIKILEAWAASTPVVATPFSAAGAGLRSGVDGWIADTPREWVETIARLLDDQDLARSVARAARARVEAENSPEGVAAAVRAAAARVAGAEAFRRRVT
jgi:glycosyltransferase involved in cell wall biosynthesis